MNTEATARVTFPGNQTGSVPDLTVNDDDGSQQTLWDFTAFAPEHQTFDGAIDLLADNGWRPAGEAAWQESHGRWTLSVEKNLRADPMGWQIGFDSRWDRDIGYGVPATCDYPGCGEAIDRGLSYVCGGEPYGGEHGCGLYFCGEHLLAGAHRQLCERCVAGIGLPPFDATPDTREWIEWKLADESWGPWRDEHPEAVRAMQASLVAANGG